jgi:hypothetical protein
LNNIGLKMVNLTPYANSAELEDFHRKMCDMSVMLLVGTEKHIQHGVMDQIERTFFSKFEKYDHKSLEETVVTHEAIETGTNGDKRFSLHTYNNWRKECWGSK